MELRDSGQTISFFSRIIFQVPTIGVSTLTMIAISRNLGPVGRGEISQILLLAALASSVLCTPIFLTIMNLGDSAEIKSYISRSLFLFSRNNVAVIVLIDAYLFFVDRTKSQHLDLSVIAYMNLLIISYFIAAQIRDLFLRFHRNKIYGVDFAAQMLISGPILILLLAHALSVLRVIQIFTITYAVLSIFLLLLLRSRVDEFSLVNLFRKRESIASNSNILKVSASFSKSGLLFQMVLSKDLLFGLILLAKADFGLMSALTSFWFVLRFLRPSAVVQAKLGQGTGSESGSRGKFLAFITRPSSAIYLQSLSIGLMGFLSYTLTPILMGRGFKPGIAMTIAGSFSEILLMKCLYDLSISNNKFSQNSFAILCFLQFLVLGILRLMELNVSILMIWFTSCVVYMAWQFLNLLKRTR